MGGVSARFHFHKENVKAAVEELADGASHHKAESSAAGAQGTTNAERLHVVATGSNNDRKHDVLVWFLGACGEERRKVGAA